YENSVFGLQLHLVLSQTRQYDLNLNASDLNLKQWLGIDASPLLDIKASGKLSFAANATIDLGLGFDLSDIGNPHYWISPSTTVSASVSASAANLHVEIGVNLPVVGSLALIADGGTASVALSFQGDLGKAGADANGDG